MTLFFGFIVVLMLAASRPPSPHMGIAIGFVAGAAIVQQAHEWIDAWRKRTDSGSGGQNG